MVITPGTGSSTALPTIVSTKGFVGLIFSAPASLPQRVWALASLNFFWRRLSRAPLADFPDLDLEALRTLPRAVGVPFLTVARFFRWAMIATFSCVHPKNALCKQPRQAKGVRTDTSAHQALSGGGSLIGGPTIPAHLPRKRHRNALASADQCLSSRIVRHPFSTPANEAGDAVTGIGPIISLSRYHHRIIAKRSKVSRHGNSLN